MRQKKTLSGIVGWQGRVREVYTTLAELEQYSETHGITKRLGYDSPEQLWEDNPIIEGSTNPSDLRVSPIKTIDRIITRADSRRGAPMGRMNVGTKPTDQRVYDCRVPMVNGGYDRGGAYWGLGKELRVEYTKDLSYIHFYRKGEK
jgi:hypothetical protein